MRARQRTEAWPPLIVVAESPLPKVFRCREGQTEDVEGPPPRDGRQPGDGVPCRLPEERIKRHLDYRFLFTAILRALRLIARICR